MKHTVTTTLEVPEQLLSDTLVTAFDGGYGGCWYWATTKPGAQWLETAGKDDDWVQATVHEEDEEGNATGSERIVSFQTLVLGIQRILDANAADGSWARKAETLRTAIVEDDAGMIDADLADNIVQEGLFGKQVYA